jgi:Protein of unknown function (DUF1036)
MSRTDVSFTNSHGTKIFVAYSRWDLACLNDCGDGWDVLGWINLEPGQTQTRPNPTGNRWFYYYAEAADGTIYNGPFLDEVKDDRFQKCSCLGVSVSHGTNPWYEVGFDELDLDEWSGVNFL